MAARVSIIVPIYNGSQFLGATLESLLRQTFTDFEILCIDDGSTDDSIEIVSRYEDPRIRLLQHSNQGLCETLNRGLAEVKSPFVARSDQDDLSDPIRIERQYNLLIENPSIKCLFTHYRKIGRKRSWDNADKQRATGQLLPFRGIPNGCQLASTMFGRTDFLRNVGGFRHEYYPADDWDFQLRLSEAGDTYILEEPLVTYRFHLGANTYPLFSLMQLKGRWAEDSHQRRLQGLQELSFLAFLDTTPKNRVRRILVAKSDLAKLQLRLAGQHYLDGEYVKAGTRGLLSLLLEPRSLLGRFRRICGC